MADKTFPLSIVIRTVDKATAGIKAITDRLNAATSPFRNLGKSLGGLSEAAGLPKLVEAFRGVGSAVRDVLGHVAKLALGLVAAGVGVKALIAHFDDMGDLAERIGIPVDALAQLRFAAKISGASVEALDSGLQFFTKSLGQARAGTGELVSFIGKVSPVLLKQLKGTKSVEEATLLMADAMAKVKDPTKRLALAAAAFGRSGGAELAPLLAKGSAGVKALMQRYADLAGSQKDAADTAGDVDNAMHELDASTDGLKAAIVSGLGPAILQLIQRLTEFLRENREKIAEWMKAIGEGLPKAVDKLVVAFNDVIAIVQPVWERIGGLKGALIILASVIGVKLVAAVVAFGVALATTPIGWIIAGIAALAAGAALLIANWDKVGTFFSDLWLGIKQTFADAWADIKGIVDEITGAVDKIVGTVIGTGENTFVGKILKANEDASERGRTVTPVTPPGARNTEARVKVDFTNAPKGTRVTTDPASTADVNFSVGYQMFVLP